MGGGIQNIIINLYLYLFINIMNIMAGLLDGVVLAMVVGPLVRSPRAWLDHDTPQRRYTCVEPKRILLNWVDVFEGGGS